MSKQTENAEGHKCSIQHMLDKCGGGDIAKKQYDLLVEKTQHPLTKSLPGKFKMGQITDLRKTFAELDSFIRNCQGDKCKELVAEFDSLLTSYQIWQSAEEIQQKPQKPKDGILRKKNRTGIKKRYSLTVRASRAGSLPKDWSIDSSLQKSDEIQKLKHENELLSIQVDELTTRLSKIASDKLTDGNPNFANLSDKNRPTKIGEKFGQVYDDEWSEAFDEIKSTCKKEDAEVYEILLNIVLAGQKFCQEVSQSQLRSIEKGMSEPILRPMWLSGEKEYSVEELEANAGFKASVKKSAKDFRRGTALASIVPLCTIFKDAKFKDIFPCDVYKMENLNLYIDACIECLWLMSVQDPPMHITCLRKGDDYEPAHYGMFLTRGKAVDYTVWPAVFLYKNGPLVSKGYVKLI